MYIYCLLIPIARFIFPPKKPGFLLQASYFQKEHHSDLAKIQEMGIRLRTYLLSFILQMSWPINYLIFFLGIFYILHSTYYVWGKEKTGPSSFVRWQNLRNMREIQYELCDFPTPQIRDARWPEIFWRFFTQIGSRAMPRLAWFRFYRGRGQQKPINFLMSIMGWMTSWDLSLPLFSSQSFEANLKTTFF